MNTMKIKVIDGTYAVCKLKSEISPPERGFFSLTRTADEITLVCEEGNVPQQEAIQTEDGFAMFRIEGQLDFSLIGILADISGILAGEKISIFCISTYDTDYILLKKDQLKNALDVLDASGYDIL